jgi:alkaline phosphatase D
MRIDRRQALGLMGAGVASPACATPPPPGYDGSAEFRHGVASGDPTGEGAVLWTRVTPVEPATPSAIPLSCSVGRWTDDGQGEPLFVRQVEAGPDRDYTVKLDLERHGAPSLDPGAAYWFQFRVSASQIASPVGRFRTLPVEDSTDEVVLAVASCSLHPGGYFNAYEAIAGLERVDAVVHLGDYIYEYGGAASDYGMRTGLELGRIPEPAHEIVTLADYRLRHAQYKADTQLQAAHARAAWIMTFDDHEVTNDPWEGGAENHDGGEGSWAARKAAALQAYLEWNPIRDPAPGTPLHEAVRRSFRFGQTAALHMVETRLSARSLQFEYEDITREDGSIDRDRLHDPERRLMGQAQLDWLGEAMTNDAAWQVLGNQVLMARLVVPNLIDAVGAEAIEAAMPGLADYQQRRLREMVALGGAAAPLNLDAWDGYPIERLRLYHKVREANGRLVVLSGDSHAAWASNLHDGEGLIVGVEFGATAVSSPQPSYSRALPGAPMAQMVVDASPDLEWCEFEPRGFFVLSLTPERTECRMIGLSTIMESTFETSERARFTTAALAAGTVGPLTRI